MYQVLARKYRPKNFHELLGQTHVSTALINGIEQHRLHHAYLFTGTRGVGKTTIARILAKCLNCETGVTSEPCGVCSTCVSIDSGRFIDLIEIDAASRTKVEDTRELLDNVPYAPTQGRYKVYLIDEVHMLSTHSFNALLKTLEEPPEHVKFLLATTDPQKLPITIISRCLQFVLRPIPQNQLADYLGVILQKEQIAFEPDALWQLASSARGSVRDALSLTDQAIAFGNGRIEPITVKNMLGLIDQADVVGLLLAVVHQQSTQIAQYIAQLREQVVDAKAVFDSMAEILHQVALLQILPDFDLQLNSEQTQARYRLAQHIPADLLQLYYEITVKSRENIALANTPLQALEMCILRLLAFRPLNVNEVVQPSAISPVIEVLPNKNADNETSKHIETTVQNASHSDNPIPIEPNQPAATNLVETNLVETNLVETNLNENNVEQSQANETLNYTALAQTGDLIENYPSINEQTTVQPAVKTEEISPLSLLRPNEQVMEGEWTPQKWDYWVYQARLHHWLAEDELVLAKWGVMTGHINGKCKFFAPENSLSKGKTFDDFSKKLQQHFPAMQITLHTSWNENEPNMQNNVPEMQQNSRRQQALDLATQQIQQTPVIQALLSQHAHIEQIQLREDN